MKEYRYNWKKIGPIWRQVPSAPCPECHKEQFTMLIGPTNKSMIPFTSTKYRKTVECLHCGHIDEDTILSEDENDDIVDAEEIPVNK